MLIFKGKGDGRIASLRSVATLLMESIQDSLTQTEQHANSVIITLNHELAPASIRMRFTGTFVVGHDETNNRNAAFVRRISKFHLEYG